jgi:hypothetical protein
LDSIENIESPLPCHVDSSLDIIKVLELAVHQVDAEIVYQGSSRAYKSSKHLCINSGYAVKVPRESVYDAEMYRIFVNWLKHIHGIEVTGQWHLQGMDDTGDSHHLYCDLTIKRPNQDRPIAILELLATASRSTLDKHFLQIFNYAQQLQSEEMWIIHFSREDNLLSSPYWPSKELQKKGLNIVHFWHDQEFINVRMSARFSNTANTIEEISDHQVLP